MEIKANQLENQLEKERSGSRALYVENKMITLYPITYWLNALKHNGTTSFIGEMT
jgi:hypothetical protein